MLLPEKTTATTAAATNIVHRPLKVVGGGPAVFRKCRQLRPIAVIPLQKKKKRKKNCRECGRNQLPLRPKRELRKARNRNRLPMRPKNRNRQHREEGTISVPEGHLRMRIVLLLKAKRHWKQLRQLLKLLRLRPRRQFGAAGGELSRRLKQLRLYPLQ